MTFVDIGWMILFGLIGLVGIALGRRLFGFWFSPLSVFVGMNCFSMVSYHMRLLVFTDASFETHAVLLLGMAMFAVGSVLALDGAPRKWLTDKPTPLDDRGLDFFFNITAFLASIGWVTAVLVLISRHGLGSLLNNIWVLQTEFQMQFIGYLNMIGILVLPTFVLKMLRQRVRLWEFALTGAALFGLLLAGIKAYLVYSILTTFFVWSTARPDRFRISYLLSGLVVMLGFFIVYTNKVDIFAVDKFESTTWFAKFVPLHRPYVYFVGSWPALENIVNGSIPYSPITGFVVLQPLWKLLGDGLGIIDPIPFNLPFTNIGTTFFNVYSLCGEVYWDFGWPGVVILLAALGHLSTKLYLRARCAGYWAHHLVYGIIGYGLFLAPFVYSYRFNVFVMLGYLFIVGFVILRRGVLIAEARRG